LSKKRTELLFVLRYIDQPVQSGFSYDKLVNGSLDLFTDRLSRLSRPNFTRGQVKQNTTRLVGTFPSNDYSATTNSSANSARALWYSLQVFLQDFPEYQPKEQKVSLWSESYGGKFGPTTTAFIQRQNQNLASGAISKQKFKHIKLDTLGIISGCIDFLVQLPSYPRMAFNNTYGLKIINQATYNRAMSAFNQKGGCQDAIARCRQMAAQRDPKNQGINAAVNSACQSAIGFCIRDVEQGFEASGRSSYDIAAPVAGMFDLREPYRDSSTLSID
jgi:carboxypeptidase D